jgi:hypothetical protein
MKQARVVEWGSRWSEKEAPASKRRKQERPHKSGFCSCGCGAEVSGRKVFALPACRKRAQRMRQEGVAWGYMRDKRHGWRKITRPEPAETLTD